MRTLLPSPQRNAISDGDQKGSRSVCGFNAPTTQRRRRRAGQQHEHCRGHRPPRAWWALTKSREFPWWLLPAGRFPVVAGSRRKFSRGGRFRYKKSRAFPWWLVPREGFTRWPNPVQTIPSNPVVVNPRRKSSQHQKSFPRTAL